LIPPHRITRHCSVIPQVNSGVPLNAAHFDEVLFSSLYGTNIELDLRPRHCRLSGALKFSPSFFSCEPGTNQPYSFSASPKCPFGCSVSWRHPSPCPHMSGFSRFLGFSRQQKLRRTFNERDCCRLPFPSFRPPSLHKLVDVLNSFVEKRAVGLPFSSICAKVGIL